MNNPPAPSSSEGSKTYLERDNVGTRYETAADVKDYSMSRDMQGLKVPFIYYYFYVGYIEPKDGKADAIAAMTELPCFHIATDSGKLISTEPLDFGLYSTLCNDGSGKIASWSVFISGKHLTLEIFEAAIASFKKHDGHEKRVSDPPPPQSKPAEQTADAGASSVEFVREERATQMGMDITKGIYKAPSKAAALAYLQANPVDKPLYYLEIDTPEGRFGRDMDGIYG